MHRAAKFTERWTQLTRYSRENLLKRLFAYALIIFLALSVSCNKEDQRRVEELSATLAELEGKSDEMGLPPAAASPAMLSGQKSLPFA